ncbi:carbonate dehydratase [Stygiobacter electus]|uniref:Carbonic anhydrase n=1 Tax=Stygiobacter electus TaxID=3032292 RepID=A0AAE3NZH6_9BACT|nr:carbonate dehydratase [Stygiobacter electus]MDF1611579.1 carbonate dehydratase [Stygiobacter electus]
MSDINRLLENNKEWSKKIKENDPTFFKKLSKQQSPEYLWIGCSDSRVPANEIVGLLPGEIFVHRNIANVIVHTDLNALSVIQFAVDVLNVKHIIVCGHYNCGGIKAALEKNEHGLIDNWLRHIKDVYRFNQKEFAYLKSDEEKLNRLCELNVHEQVANVCNTTIVQNAWRIGKDLTVHGWIYGLHNGLLKDLKISVSSIDKVNSIYRTKTK